jgi:hypothetical protein
MQKSNRTLVTITLSELTIKKLKLKFIFLQIYLTFMQKNQHYEKTIRLIMLNFLFIWL